MWFKLKTLPVVSSKVVNIEKKRNDERKILGTRYRVGYWAEHSNALKLILAMFSSTVGSGEPDSK
jgi:hypothetical protein